MSEMRRLIAEAVRDQRFAFTALEASVHAAKDSMVELFDAGLCGTHIAERASRYEECRRRVVTLLHAAHVCRQTTTEDR